MSYAYKRANRKTMRYALNYALVFRSSLIALFSFFLPVSILLPSSFAIHSSLLFFFLPSTFVIPCFLLSVFYASFFSSVFLLYSHFFVIPPFIFSFYLVCYTFFFFHALYTLFFLLSGFLSPSCFFCLPPSFFFQLCITSRCAPRE